MATETILSHQSQTESAGRGFNWGIGLTVASGVLMVTALYLALAWAPDAVNLEAPAERYAQRIFYFHVPSAWIGFLAFVVSAVTALLYLITRQEKWDVWSLASVEIGLAFFYNGHAQWPYLGQTYLECLVDMGPPFDHLYH